VRSPWPVRPVVVSLDFAGGLDSRPTNRREIGSAPFLRIGMAPDKKAGGASRVTCPGI